MYYCGTAHQAPPKPDLNMQAKGWDTSLPLSEMVDASMVDDPDKLTMWLKASGIMSTIHGHMHNCMGNMGNRHHRHHVNMALSPSRCLRSPAAPHAGERGAEAARLHLPHDSQHGQTDLSGAHMYMVSGVYKP